MVDSSVTQYENIHISGGQRGLNVRINVEDLLNLIHPTIAVISTPLEQDCSQISTN